MNTNDIICLCTDIQTEALTIKKELYRIIIKKIKRNINCWYHDNDVYETHRIYDQYYF